MTLRIGRISYLNVAPYFHFLREEGFCGEILSGVPAELNAMLADGVIDACPSSSFEYGLHADDYYVLPGHSISSIGPVHSVLLFTPGPVSVLSDQKVAITGESATSINLLRVLLKEFCGGIEVAFTTVDADIGNSLAQGKSVLLIGDRALKAARHCPRGQQVTDLGALWYHFTGLPFVFALWILRRRSADEYPAEIKSLAGQLQRSRQRAFANLKTMAQQLSATSGFPAADLVSYWHGMSYDLTDGHLEGLRLFFTLCQKHGLLREVPEFHFSPAI